MKNRTTAALLALFLGGIGAHKFYLRKTGVGILYLVFCWTFIPSIIAFIEAIIFFTMSDEKFDLVYNTNALLLGAYKNAAVVSSTVVSTPVHIVNNQFSDGHKNVGKIEVSDELEKLHNLKEKGVINEIEFDKRKAHLLS